ncbi:phytoene desaturase family protein [Aquisphaera insulae]|uniref:phytoene desaturase family protein n=1 Tax=Aquisphaera insulae TaxID=2712864 RepID=UPI0013EA9B18|nr:NAD(P)/FAD-dependent oxidoreductase [Aquisphaera insulae]
MIYDLLVIGGGVGGLATAALAQRMGLTTALLEAHTKLGGCAGYFGRGPFTFDAGATALMGLGPGEPLGDLLARVGLDFETVPASGYRVHLPDRSIEIVPDAAEFLARDAAAFGPTRADRRRIFWDLQAFVGGRLFRAAGRVPRLPARSAGDLWHDLKILGLSGVTAASTAAITVRQMLRILGLEADLPFRSFLAMLLQDTAQAGPETVPFANAAACLHAYRLGMRRPRGGMRALAEGLGRRFAEQGGVLHTGTLVDRVESRDGSREFVVVTRRRHRLTAREVVFNLPLDLAARLLGRDLEGPLARAERKSRAVWGAFTGYLAIDRAAIPDDSPLFHQVLRDYDAPIHDGNNILVSLSPAGDEGYGPPRARIVTMSTHTELAGWKDLDGAAYAARKSQFRDRLLAALARALPDAPGALIHEEFASPRSFRRYTRRTGGAVGGAPVSRWNSNALAVGSDVLGPGLWVVGDSVFPGQGTMAVAISAIRVVERITGRPWWPLADAQRLAPPTGRANLQPQP